MRIEYAVGVGGRHSESHSGGDPSPQRLNLNRVYDLREVELMSRVLSSLTLNLKQKTKSEELYFESPYLVNCFVSPQYPVRYLPTR